MRGRSLTGLLVVLTAVLAAACFDPLFDENQPSAGEKSLCCAEATHTLDTHIAAPGELASSRIFPGCKCYAGSQCRPFYKAAAGGACYPLQSGFQDGGTQLSDAGSGLVDAGTGFADAGGFSDAGSGAQDAGVARDAGTAASDAGAPIDAGVPTDWSACCVGGLITTCLCPVTGTCPAAEFRLCGGQTCSLSTCSAQ